MEIIIVYIFILNTNSALFQPFINPKSYVTCIISMHKEYDIRWSPLC